MNTNNELNQLFALVSKPILIADQNRKIVFANIEAKSLLNIDQHSVDMSFDKILHINNDQIQLLKARLSSHDKFVSSTHIQDNNGQDLLLNFLIKPIRSEKMNHLKYYIELEDPNDDGLSPEEIQRLGQFTGKLAHDIANPLAIIRIQCDSMFMKLEKNVVFDKEQLTERISKLSRATDRVIALNEDIKTLSVSLIQSDQDGLKKLMTKNKSDEFNH